MIKLIKKKKMVAFAWELSQENSEEKETDVVCRPLELWLTIADRKGEGGI